MTALPLRVPLPKLQHIHLFVRSSSGTTAFETPRVNHYSTECWLYC
uniref:Uncharacterized protein n=1 Tax=Rhizophora mucronata TaxID=61149 RepID=A0A2P2PBP1_RHIMU